MEHLPAQVLRSGVGEHRCRSAGSTLTETGGGWSLMALGLDLDGTSFWIPAMAILILTMGVVIGALLARHRRLIADLNARLEIVECPPTSVGSEGSDEPSPQPGSSAPGDVLHGHTSYVQAMIGDADSGAKSLADQVIVAIHDQLEDPITPRQLAAAVNVSVRTIERVLRATLDCSPRQLILTMKMREAQRLLCANELRIGEIAYRLGFSSAAHFSTRFRSFSGTTPTSFRRAALTSRCAHPDGQVASTQGNAHEG